MYGCVQTFTFKHKNTCSSGCREGCVFCTSMLKTVFCAAALGAKCCQTCGCVMWWQLWSRHVVVKRSKGSPKNASKQMVTRHGQKEVSIFNVNKSSPQQCGTNQKEKQMKHNSELMCCFCPSFPPPLLLHANRDSNRTTLLPHVVASL